MTCKLVDYFLAPVSPWTYLGHDRFVAIARHHGADIDVKPIDTGRVFAASGGLPLKQRAPQRQAYRLVELARWSKYLGIPLNLHPVHFPVSGDLASRWILAASEAGIDEALAFVGGIGRAIWAEQRNIADAGTLADIARALGLDAAAIGSRADAAEIGSRYDALTQEAIDRGVFGVPTYFCAGEPFWGQDRLDFLDRALAE
ncbi:MAG TPA: 2-hydroxychromene-2-carboxylate isomerase [Casimicrobiaceae bacterium]|nr:2-hydroxychromene-2-carboxylate isomerase [Casimicrobiaceae bacterium]